jgi:hypothetical protein
MSGRVVSDIQTRAEGESLYIRYNTDANVVNGLKNDSSYEFVGEVILTRDPRIVWSFKLKKTLQELYRVADNLEKLMAYTTK